MENTPSAPISNSPTSPRLKFFNPKVVFIILVVIVIVEIIFAVGALTQTASQRSKVLENTTVTMSVTSVKKEYKIGDVVPVSILLDTAGKKAIGTDAILHFDPKVLEATSSAIEKGTIYQDYPALGIDGKLGTVTVSGINSADVNFSGIGVLASINFTAKTSGSTTVSLEFTPGSTTDTNIVDPVSGGDILQMVNNLKLSIK